MYVDEDEEDSYDYDDVDVEDVAYEEDVVDCAAVVVFDGYDVYEYGEHDLYARSDLTNVK